MSIGGSGWQKLERDIHCPKVQAGTMIHSQRMTAPATPQHYGAQASRCSYCRTGTQTSLTVRTRIINGKLQTWVPYRSAVFHVPMPIMRFQRRPITNNTTRNNPVGCTRHSSKLGYMGVEVGCVLARASCHKRLFRFGSVQCTPHTEDDDRNPKRRPAIMHQLAIITRTPACPRCYVRGTPGLMDSTR